MKSTITICILTVLTFSCKNSTAKESNNLIVKGENIETKREEDSKEEKKKSFMDFFDAFMWDKEFQQKSIKYPINVEDKTIASNSEWVYLPFFTNTSYIPSLHSDTLNYYDFEITNRNITLTSVSFKSKTFTDYKFIKQNSDWQLTNIFSDSIQKVRDFEFISFLQAFSNDSNFQINHTKFPLQNYYADSEKEYETVYESIEREGWKYFNLVKEIENLVIINIEKVSSEYRNISLRGVDNGIYVKYTFRKINGEWILIKLEDYST